MCNIITKFFCFLFFSISFLSLIFINNLKADSLDDKVDRCVDKKIENASKPEPFSKIGRVETDPTGGDGKRHSRDGRVCFDVPAGFTIKKVEPKEISFNGSDHTISGIVYEYDDEGRVTKACVNIHVRGPHGHYKGRGWVEVKLFGTVTKHISPGLKMAFMKECAKEIYGK